MRSRATGLVPAGAVTLAVALAGCGGSSGPSDKQQIETTLTTYYKAFSRGDSAGACQELSAATRATLERAGRGKGCSQILDAALKRPDYAAVATKLAGAQVTQVTVGGDKATAVVVVPGVKVSGGHGARRSVPLIKEHGAWKIAAGQ